MKNALILLGLALLVLPACDDDSDDDTMVDATVDAAPITEVDELCAALAEEICGGLERCDCRFDVRAYDAAGCVARRTSDCVTNLVANVGADIEAGNARIEPVIARGCVTAVRTMADSCTASAGLSGALPKECDAFVLASAVLGEACTTMGGGLAFCGAMADGVCLDGESNTRTCTELPAVGTDCLQGLCKAGLVCDGTVCAEPGDLNDPCLQSQTCAKGLVCGLDQKCVAPLALNAPCVSIEQCDTGLVCNEVCVQGVALGNGCANSFVCGTEHTCGRAPETRTCTDPDGQGDVCMTDTCGAGLSCDSAMMQCVLLPGDGATCLDGSQCTPGFTCLDGLGTCGALPGLGETCAAGQRFCAEGLGCRTSDNTCQPGPGQGEECFPNPPDTVCGEGLGCDFATEGSFCQPITGAGTACNTDRTCAPQTYCENSTLECTTRLAAGSPCEDGNECQAGHECAVLPSGTVCVPLPERDEACLFDCDDELACKGPGGECGVAFCTIPG